MANPQAENGHIDIAHEIAEKLSRYRISGEEYQVLWVIWRKTYGWHKKEDCISLSQFYSSTEMKKPSIIRALNKLASKNIVSKRANDIANNYRFNKDFDTWKPLAKKLIVSKRANGISKRANKSLAKELHTKETIKETITKEIIPKKVLMPYGRSDINQVISFLKEKIGGSPDGSMEENRRFAKFLLDRFKKDYPAKNPEELVQALITYGLEDSFHGKNITSFKYLYYNAQKIIASVKSKHNNSNLLKI